MLGIPDEEVVEEGKHDETPGYEGEGVRLRYNHTDPTVISDGVDRVAVVDEGESYLVDYGGYESGYLRVTAEGIEELGRALLDDRAEVPGWVVADLPADLDELPWWVPDDFDGPRTVECQRCGADTPATEVLTPGVYDADDPDRYCRDCWDAIGDRWRPDRSFGGETPVERARSLHDETVADPHAVAVDTVVGLVDAADPDAREEALHAVAEVAETRPGDALDVLPRVASGLEDDSDRVRAAALHCLDILADDHPRRITPAADEVVALLGVDTADPVLERSVSVVASVADADPEAVLDAVPTLGALLQDGSHERQVIVALTRISEGHPEAVVPVVPDLLKYVDDPDGIDRVATLAAVGYVAREYPNVAESAIPTLIDLLDADEYRLRANAAGLLADQADEYPGEVRPAVPRVIELLDDEDDKVRYNATSILARVAKEYPDAVDPAVDPLVGALDEEFQYARSNACWALGYLRASGARDALEERSESDPDEEVRNAAEWALRQIEDGDR